MRSEGVVKVWKDDLGYGFVETQDGTSVFVHRKSIMTPAGSYIVPKLYKGEIVTFLMEDKGKKNPCAGCVAGLNGYPVLCYLEQAQSYPAKIPEALLRPQLSGQADVQAIAPS